ncbi:zinc finger CCHC domain-containing protein 7-like isoform X3 [Cucurbita pepo subsp. pepo]|uniref:zinc finger CCHC domain-containing protein 7-like isoform X3 n=1 Tax=Cucurbita pepo subsp. pepo TaxID=3664 RepID=UPI000C9D840A|nr:zinc finger CCHC domain-containing protein 7-like isoform X3 [Cucurbita pepo subsp. pepo]
MGRRGKLKKFKFEEDEDELKERASKTTVVVSSDDEEANEDFSLKIVEKALRLRSGKLVRFPDHNQVGNREQSGNGDVDGVGVVEVSSSPLRDADTGAGTSGTSVDVIAATSEARELGSKKSAKKRKRKVKKLETEEPPVVVTEGEKIETIPLIDQVDSEEPKITEIETTPLIDQVDSEEPNITDTTNNNVFRKLLRGPRYFDPPDSWGACYNCGEEGHNAVSCTSAKRKKPCFVCGSLEHNARSCLKARDCYICNKVGHRAKDCPEKHLKVSSSSKICLKCGDPGHDMFSCQSSYPDDDLENIQCYICKKLGHLCCVNSTSDTSIDISCYKCGKAGHTGLACSRLRGEASAAVSASSCYRCGEEGHFARECTSSAKLAQGGKKNREEASGAASPSPCYRCGEEGHFARECTSSAKVDKKAGPFVRECTISAKGGKKNREDASGAASPNPCYRCGEDGHFSRECPSSTKGSKRNIEVASGAESTNSCYRCGGEGHFARECTSSTKGGKRNRELSKHKSRSKTEETYHMGSKSAPHNLAKAHSKKKKINYDEKYTNLPRKSGQKGRWMMEDPGPRNFFNGTSMNNNWNSPVTPSRWDHDYYTEYPGHYASPQFSGRYASPPRSSGYYASPQSLTRERTLHPGTPMSFQSSIAPQNGFSASRFGGFSNEGRRKSYGWW